MRVRLTLSPGRNGTKKLHRPYGHRRGCVRYRSDAARGLRHEAAEGIVDEAPWTPREPARAKPARHRAGDPVYVRIDWHERELRAVVKAAGAIWRPRHKLWELDYGAVRTLGLTERVVGEE